MQQHNKCSFTLNETIEENELPPDNENYPHLKRNTPILFSSNRGLHLRMTTNATAVSLAYQAPSTSTNTGDVTNSNYSVVFCDLERWSTNRANTISLEDTFNKTQSVKTSSSRPSNSVRFLPHTHTSTRFNGYSRFDMN